MRPRVVLAALACALWALVVAAPAHAYEYGSNFGFADVNVPGAEQVPVYPGDRAVWVGTCDLSSADTSEGGFGSAPGTLPHCLDVGTPTSGGEPPFSWAPGGTPAWLLRPVTQAGAHPDGTVSFRFRRAADGGGGSLDGNVKNIVVGLPLGFVGNPEALPKCPAVAAQSLPPACGPESQVGMSTLLLYPSAEQVRTHPIYGIEARDTVTAEFTISSVANLFNVPLTARGRTNSDYGVDTLALLIPSFIPLQGTQTTLWGVPWAAEHDKYRVDSPTFFSDTNAMIELEGHSPAEGAQSYDPAWGPIKPFLTTPTSCSSGTPTLFMQADSWQNPVSFGGAYAEVSAPTEPITGCDKLEFDPQTTLRPTVEVADSPSGLDVRLSIPQNNDPPAAIPGNPDLAHDPADDSGAPAYWRSDAGLARAHLRNTTVRLPQGTSFNPAAANGIEGCTTKQIGLVSTNPTTFDNDPVQCPESSKIGGLEIVSPLLADPLEGAVYAAPQNDNPYPGSLTSVYMVSQDEERGLSIKLSGKVDLDPRTGQISTTFLDNPQLPFDEFRLRFKDGPRAPLNTPPVCGQFRNGGELVPWSYPDSGPATAIQDPFDIAAMPNGLACVTEPEDRLFRPGFEAFSTNPVAGAATEFALRVTREDGTQEVSALGLDMPAGLIANLSQTPYCPEAAIASVSQRTGLAETISPSCPAASRIGTVNSLAGAGSMPLPTSGNLYLAGPFDPDGSGPKPPAPLSILAVVPAIAGGTPGAPAFDLGNVAIRSAAYLDSDDAEVHISSTPLPYIVGGVPLRVRRIAVNIDKPGFMLNPTDCSEMAVGGQLGGAADPLDPSDDVALPVANRFQVGGCERLPFKPRLTLRFKGGTKRGDYQRLRAVLRPRPGDANISRAAVTLPRSAYLAQENMGTICTRVRFAANQCPKRSQYGIATAVSPLLAEPLSGPVYLRSSNNVLPDLVASLGGQVDIELVGRIDSVRGKGIRSTFEVVPDAPVTKFTLDMFGGRRSLIVNSTNICRFAGRATVRFSAQNGRRLSFRPKVANSCSKKRRRSRSRPRR